MQPSPVEHIQRPEKVGRAGAAKPLSSAQERLWWFSQIHPSSANVALAMHLRGPINLMALRQTLRSLVARHPMLRTKFRLERGAPVQEVCDCVAVDIPEVALHTLDESIRETVAERLMREAAERPLDTASPPLFRPLLFCIDAQHHLLLIRLSHLLVDERSRQLLMQEMSAIYSAFDGGQPFAEPASRLEYGDYALRERALLGDPSIEKHLDAWDRYLADLPPLLDLPLDHPRPSARSYRGAWRAVQLPMDLSESITRLARSEGVTTFHVLLSAFFVLLARQTACTDIALGTPFSHVPDRRYAQVIGPFLNSLVVRSDCSGRPSFRNFLRHVRSRLGAAIAHAIVPFEAVVERMRIPRDPSYNPLIQAWFVHRPYIESRTSWSGPAVDPVEMHETAMPFDITLALSEHTRGVTCSCTYDTELFEAATIDRFLSQYRRILSGVVDNVERAIDDYEILSPQEYRLQVVSWNDTVRVWNSPSCLHEAVMASAARSPSSIAILDDQNQMTYGELATSVRRLAARLRTSGVTVDSRVGILMPRSPDIIVAILAVLQAGGAYLPLDPTTGAGRVNFVLRDADAACVITTKALRARVAEAPCPIMVFDDDQGADQWEALESRTTGAHLCYVLYTSGTTGEPKGVAVSHFAVMNNLESFGEALQVTTSDTMLAIAPTNFDISVLEIFLPLIRGARVYLAPEHTGASGSELRRRLDGDGITIAQATPVTWRLLLEAGWSALPGLRIVSGAEALPAELARKLILTAGHVINSYGPTETTIYSTFEPMTDPNAAVTIGRPIANTSVYVLDKNWMQVPVGVWGEIFIGGQGLARCYLNRPALTAAAFVPDPFHPTPGVSMYASGDMGRFCTDGRIECRGRRDHQVKVNGRRIELGAVSHALESHPLVQGSIVKRYDTDRGACLVAYVVSRAREPIPRDVLREHIAQRLPPYMLPAAIVQIDSFPKTRRGKIDPDSLPAPQGTDFHQAGNTTAPRTPTEETIAEVWLDSLPGLSLGVEDDFFALGGTSLQVTRVLQGIRAALGVDVSVHTFFDAPTVLALARHVDELRASMAVPGNAVRTIPRDGALHLAPQQENWWYNEVLTGSIHPNNIHFGFRFTGPLNREALKQTIDFLQRRHEAFRTAFVPGANGSASVVVTPPDQCELPLLHVDLTTLPQDRHEKLLQSISNAERSRPFNLQQQDSLCRFVVVHLGPEEHVVLFTVHHLIFDEWSMNIVTRDASAAYSSIVNGTPTQLPALEFQYVDFARWQSEWLSSRAAADQLSYWREHLAPPLPPLLDNDAIKDEDWGTPLTLRARVPIFMEMEATTSAREIARIERCTLFSTLMAALKLALYWYSEQRDIRIGTLISNRGLPGAQDVVGLFTNVACIRTEIDPALPFREYVRNVHTAIKDAGANQDLPFEILLRELSASSPSIRENLLQAMVVWLAMPPDTLRMSGASTSAWRAGEEEGESIVFARNALDLRFELVESASGIEGNITYNMSRFTAAQIHAIAEMMEQCLTNAALEPAATVAKVCARLPVRAAEQTA